jgi:hypothetical protein
MHCRLAARVCLSRFCVWSRFASSRAVWYADAHDHEYFADRGKRDLHPWLRSDAWSVDVPLVLRDKFGETVRHVNLGGELTGRRR